MGKNRSASGITNVIQYDNNGNIAFVSGSTTLMQVSSSGAITTTGVISGSNALSASFSLNSALLNGTGSVGFATTASLLTVSSSQQQISSSLLQVSASQQQLSSSFLTLTASFNAVSSSQQQISASYIALSASYNTFSGSASTRITVDSASLLQVSSSQQQISASLLNVISVFATTGSNSFRATQSITGSLTVTGQIIAQTLNVQQVTSSIIYSSGSNNFGCDLNSRQTFTGSVLITGSLTIAGASSATSYSGTTIYGSTAICSPVGKFTSCIDVGGSGTFSGNLTLAASTPGLVLNDTSGAAAGSVIFQNNGTQKFNLTTLATSNNFALYNNGGTNSYNLTIVHSTGAATFSSSVTATNAILSGGSIPNLFIQSSNGGTAVQFRATANESSQQVNLVAESNHPLTLWTNSTERMRITSTGIACFACQICAKSLYFSSNATGQITFGSNDACNPYIVSDSSNNLYFGSNNGYKILVPQDGSDMVFRTSPTYANPQTRLTITAAGIATFACTICAPNVDITGQIKRIDTIYLGGSLNGTGNVTAACYQIESAYALASNRTSVSKGGQYASSAYYVLLAAAQDVYVYYKLALIQSSFFCGYTRFVNSQDGSTRSGISQYSFDNGGTWTTLGTTSFGPGYGYAAGGVATPSGNYSGVVVFRAALTSGSGNTLIGIDQLYFMSCGYGMHFINNLG